MIRVLAASSVALILLSGESSAQSRVHPGAQEVGAVIKSAHRLGIRTLIYKGPDNGLFFYEARNKIRGPEQVTMQWRDRDAQLTRMEYGDVVQTYEPHDCSLTIGRCEYTYTNIHKKRGERTESQYIVINSVSGDVWSFKRYITSESPENLRREGTFTVDEFGIKIEGKSTSYRKGGGKPSKGWSRRIPTAKR